MLLHPVTIEAYQDEWPRWAQWETERLSRELSLNLLAVEPMCSTAIPEPWAKPIIDLMPIIRQIALLDLQQPILEEFG